MNTPSRRNYLISVFSVVVSLLFITPPTIAADFVEGTATVRVDQNEYIIPIECDDAKKPMLGLNTEPARITKKRTNRTSGVRLNIRPWKDTDDLIVTLDRYVAWVSSPPGAGGVLNILQLDMSPISRVVEGIPTLLSYEDWENGERPEGLNDVYIHADCRSRDPEAPSFRKITNTGE